MTLSLTLAGISLVVIAAMLMNKQRELKGSSTLFSIGGEKTDSRIAGAWSSMVYMVTHVSVRSCKKLTRQATLAAEAFFIENFETVARKFSTVGNMVTGYDLPRNRGSVSFFLKNIEDHKRMTRTQKVTVNVTK